LYKVQSAYLLLFLGSACLLLLYPPKGKDYWIGILAFPCKSPYFYISSNPLKYKQMIVRKPTHEEVKTANSWSIWNKEASSFPWSYNTKETCYILEGEATVTGSNGKSVNFGPGDWVEFEEGLECTWNIKKAIRKRYLFG
jgi:uncharacterized protein